MEVTIDAYWLSFLVSVALPAITALVSKRLASSGLKAVILLLLSAITGTVTSWTTTGGTFEVKEAVTLTVVSFVTAVAAHYGLLKPTHVTGTDGAIAKAIPGGIGREAR